jgi:short-subunit dehydrogenase
MRVLVTGASEGIGRSFAKRFASLGYAVTAVARTESRLRDLLGELGDGGHTYLVADLSSDTGVASLFEHLSHHSYDVWINNAGFGAYGAFHEVPDDFERMLRLNCLTLTRVSQAYLKQAKPGDALINVSSIASFLPMPYSAHYAATKAFVTSLTESLWAESKSRGIYVMCLCPGSTDTLFHQSSGGSADRFPAWASQTPDQVVEIALRALRRRSQPLVLCGFQKWIAFIGRFVPKKWSLSLSERVLKSALKS